MWHPRRILQSFYMNPAPKPRPDSVPRRPLFTAVRSGAWTAQIGRAAVFFTKNPSNFSRINPQSRAPLSFFSKKPSTHTKKKTVHPPHPGASSLAAYAPTPWQTPRRSPALPLRRSRPRRSLPSLSLSSDVVALREAQSVATSARFARPARRRPGCAAQPPAGACLLARTPHPRGRHAAAGSREYRI